MRRHHFITGLIFLIYSSIYAQQSAKSDLILVPYRLKNLWGYCDTSGKILIQPKFDSVSLANRGDFLFVSKRKKKFMLNLKGKVLFGPFDTCGHFGQGNGMPYSDKEVYNFWLLNDGKAGILNTSGDTIVPIIYDELYYSLDYLQRKSKVVGKIGNTNYLISLSDKEVVETPHPYKRAVWEWNPDRPPDREKGFHVESGFSQMAYMLDSVKLKYRFDSMVKITSLAFQYGEGDLPFFKVYRNRKVGLWNTDIFVDPQYDDVLNLQLQNNTIVVKRGRKYGAANIHGKLIIPFLYDELIHASAWSSTFITRVGNKYGAAIPGGVYTTIKNQYEKLSLSNAIDAGKNRYFCIFKVKKNGMEGYVGENGIEYFKD